MFKRLRPDGKMTRSWPLIILILLGSYFASPREWWPVLTYAYIAIFHWGLFVARGLEYFFLQKRPTRPILMMVHLSFGLALFLGAFIAAPQPRGDFTWLRPYVRIAWGIGLPFFAVAAYAELWEVLKLIQLRSQRKNENLPTA